MIVADASVVVTALVDDAAAGELCRGRLRGERLYAPELIDLEVTSVVRRLLLRGDLPRARAELALAALQDLPIQRSAHRPLLSRCWSLRANLTTYDAAYVALAEALGAILITADAALARAAPKTCTVELLTS